MYCFVQEVPAPIEMYDRLHSEINARTAGRDLGLLLHVARESAGGFSIIEIWSSKEACDRAIEEYLAPAMTELFGDQLQSGPPPMTEFEPRGLLIPSAGVLI
ncbi:MAG TPA: hypothetical protein VIU11_19050 [Nakamurella sp.]